MTIKGSDWQKYINDLRAVNDLAASKMQTFLEDHCDADGLWNEPDTRALIIDYAYGLTTKYGSAAAELACQMYDAVAKRSNVSVPEAEPEETPNYEEVRAGINGSLKQSDRADVAAASVGRQVKKASVRTIRNNAKRDGAMIAWVPQGSETCAFCIMLASNGWRYANSDSYQEHIHANCDCMLAVRFNNDTEIEGYDPDYYYDIYVEGGRNPAGIRRYLEEMED